MKLKKPTELIKMTQEEYIDYIDKLHNAILNYQLLIDFVESTVSSKNQNHER